MVEAVRDLLTGARAEQSVGGIALAVASLLVIPALALAKRRTGHRLRSATLTADSAETLLCACLSAILLRASSSALPQASGGPIAWPPLAIADLAVREGKEAWEGKGSGAGLTETGA